MTDVRSLPITELLAAAYPDDARRRTLRFDRPSAGDAIVQQRLEFPTEAIYVEGPHRKQLSDLELYRRLWLAFWVVCQLMVVVLGVVLLIAVSILIFQVPGGNVDGAVVGATGLGTIVSGGAGAYLQKLAIDARKNFLATDDRLKKLENALAGGG